MIVYLDLIFLENVCMNYIIIYATILFLKLKNIPYRILLGSLIGAIYAILSVIEMLSFYNNIFMKILVSIIIMYISTDIKNFKSLLKTVLVFYFVSFMFGGIALAFLYFVKPENIMMKNGVYIGTYPIKIIFLAGILGIVLISIVHNIIRNKYAKRRKICEIEFVIEKETKKVNVLIDSGNFLKEPITGVPVIVIETSCMFGVVPKIVLENIEEIISGNLNILRKDVINNEYVEIDKFINKFRIIPFTSLGKENGLLLGIKANYIKIFGNEEFEDKKIENIIIGLYNKKLSKERFVFWNYIC